MSLRISTTRHGSRLRKSNSAPSLMSLVEAQDDECASSPRVDDASLGMFDMLNSSEWISEPSTSIAGAWLQPHTAQQPSRESGLRHVDSMELIHQRHEKLLSSQRPAKRERVAEASSFGELKPPRTCSLPHVDSCELITSIMGQYEDDDFSMGWEEEEDSPAGTGGNYAHMPQLVLRQMGPGGGWRQPGSSPFDDALRGL